MPRRRATSDRYRPPSLHHTYIRPPTGRHPQKQGRRPSPRKNHARPPSPSPTVLTALAKHAAAAATHARSWRAKAQRQAATATCRRRRKPAVQRPGGRGGAAAGWKQSWHWPQPLPRPAAKRNKTQKGTAVPGGESTGPLPPREEAANARAGVRGVRNILRSKPREKSAAGSSLVESAAWDKGPMPHTDRGAGGRCAVVLIVCSHASTFFLQKAPKPPP